MTSVISANGCCGFTLKRRHQFEAFDSDCKSLGLFSTEREAAAAIYAVLPPHSQPAALPSLEGDSV